MPNLQLRLREASAILGINPKDLQNLVQFGVLHPRRKGRYFVFDPPLLLRAKVAMYMKESLGTSVPLLAEFVQEIFRGAATSVSEQPPTVSILSRPRWGKEAVRIDVPIQALAAELQARLPVPIASRKDRGQRREPWKRQITQAFEAASEDLRGVTRRQILDEIKLYRAQRRKSPEITRIGLPQEKTA